jgi:plastocyanin
MSNETLFFICGIALTVSAVLISIVGLKVKSFPGKAMPLVVLWLAILVGSATTFAVLHAQDEQDAKAAELEQAGREVESNQTGGPYESKASEESKASGKPGSQAKPETAAKGPGGTLQLAADPTQIAYEETSLASKPGKVTIDFTNPATLEHNVAIEDPEGKELAVSSLIGKGKTSVSAELAAGTYHYFCTVPGHREAGMEGTLLVK